MCEYIQREFHCGCFRWIVSRWCSVYLRTEVKCPMTVSYYEYRGEEQCSTCKPRQMQPWAIKMMRGNMNGQTAVGL